MLRAFLLVLLILSLYNVNVIDVTQAETHDLMIVSVTPYTTEVEVNDLVNITVVVRNKGTEAETFNVTAYYDTKTIETKNVLNLASNTSASLTFLWNTTATSAGTYTIKAKADPLPGEVVTDDNTLVSTDKVRVFVSPYIGVVPASIVDPNKTSGKDYTISIYTDYGGADVWGYEFELGYNPNVLEGTEVVNGNLITEDVGTLMWFPGSFDNTAGMLEDVGNGFFVMPGEPMPVTSGPGILANVTFRVVGDGDSDIILGAKTRLIGYDTVAEDSYNIIDKAWPGADHILHGYFSNQREVIHDVAVISVTPSPTEPALGESVDITVMIENQGTVDEDVTVKVYRDYVPGVTFWLIDNGTIQNLAPGATQSLLLVWDTTDEPPGDHTITATASILSAETDLADNLLDSDQVISIAPPVETPIPIDLIIGVVAIVAIAITVIVYASRRRRKSTYK